MDTSVIKITGIGSNGIFRSWTDISIEYIKTIIQDMPNGEEVAAKFLLHKVKEIVREIEHYEDNKRIKKL